MAEKENSSLFFTSFFEKVSTPLASGFWREELEINWAIAINLKMVNEIFFLGPRLNQVPEKLGTSAWWIKTPRCLHTYVEKSTFAFRVGLDRADMTLSFWLMNYLGLLLTERTIVLQHFQSSDHLNWKKKCLKNTFRVNAKILSSSICSCFAEPDKFISFGPDEICKYFASIKYQFIKV